MSGPSHASVFTFHVPEYDICFSSSRKTDALNQVRAYYYMVKAGLDISKYGHFSLEQSVCAPKNNEDFTNLVEEETKEAISDKIETPFIFPEPGFA